MKKATKATKQKTVVMTKEKMNKYASMIAKLEGKKSQVKIGDIREILKIFMNILIEESLQNEKK